MCIPDIIYFIPFRVLLLFPHAFIHLSSNFTCLVLSINPSIHIPFIHYVIASTFHLPILVHPFIYMHNEHTHIDVYPLYVIQSDKSYFCLWYAAAGILVPKCDGPSCIKPDNIEPKCSHLCCLLPGSRTLTAQRETSHHK